MQVRDIVDLSNAMKAVLEQLGLLDEDETGRPFSKYPKEAKLNDKLLEFTQSTMAREHLCEALGDLGAAFDELLDEEVDL